LSLNNWQGNREQGTGNREQGTGNREQGTGNREQGTGNRKRVLGDFTFLHIPLNFYVHLLIRRIFDNWNKTQIKV
jgi:hypothetical protein